MWARNRLKIASETTQGCLLVDARMPGMGGIELLQRLKSEGNRLPAIMITGQGDVPMAVKAMKAGAADFIEKPIRRDELFASIEHALEHTRDSAKLSVGGRFFKNHLYIHHRDYSGIHVVSDIT